MHAMLNSQCKTMQALSANAVEKSFLPFGVPQLLVSQRLANVHQLLTHDLLHLEVGH